MTTHSSVLAWEVPWTGAWRATVHGVTRVGYDSVTDKENELPGYCTDIDWNILPRFPGKKSFLLVLEIQPEGPAGG